MTYLWLGFIVGGFFFGSILFSKIIPQLVLGKDICELGDDGNPGAANVFMKCGVKFGLLCLILDILKGFVPVFLSTFFLDTENLWFSTVMLAPVLGHAVGIFNRFHGGKCISTSFGVLLGIMPITRIGFLLAAIYILFSTLIKISPNSRRSTVSFALFAVGSALILHLTGKYSMALGCVFLSVLAIIKHAKSIFNYNKEKLENYEKNQCEN